jgi:hypothetical protein
MEQDIPAFKPQWLMQGQVTATGAASLWAAASSRKGEIATLPLPILLLFLFLSDWQCYKCDVLPRGRCYLWDYIMEFVLGHINVTCTCGDSFR